MANNKVQLANGTVLIDLTDTTATASDVASGSYFYDASGVKQSGTLVVDQTYSVTKTLTNVTSSNDDSKVISGNSFYADLTPISGYAITSITVTMGGVDVTEQVFQPGTGAKAITANGTYNASDDSLSGYDRVVVSVPPTQPDLGTKAIIENGTYAASSDSLDGYSEVTVNVPNSYTASDEGKVVSDGILIAQTSDTVTENGTVDTTLINSLTVNVPGGGITISQLPYSVQLTNGRTGTIAVVRVIYDATTFLSGYSSNITKSSTATYTDMATDGTHFWFRSTGGTTVSYNGSTASFVRSGNYFSVTIPDGFDGTIPFVIT